MKKIFFLALSLILITSLAYAEKPHGPKAIEVNISVGTADGQMKFTPESLTFERGTYYKLVITNPSSDEHYFTSDAFATHIFTRKVEVMDKEGKTIVEIHGAINDLELKPGARVEWFFFPMTKGNDLKLFCHKKGHEAQGMVGSINIIGDL
ncbi:MAG: biphenyl 2,3-dioxygenase [Proteobacteria bacterium]|nr:biphenyl 2,3-dioxygenase [Pseudomonadota bacterium]